MHRARPSLLPPPITTLLEVAGRANVVLRALRLKKRNVDGQQQRDGSEVVADAAPLPAQVRRHVKELEVRLAEGATPAHQGPVAVRRELCEDAAVGAGGWEYAAYAHTPFCARLLTA